MQNGRRRAAGHIPGRRVPRADGNTHHRRRQLVQMERRPAGAKRVMHLSQRLVVPTQEFNQLLASPPAANTTSPIRYYCSH
eukprot:8895845-Pyramimonas_sp.AAC.1